MISTVRVLLTVLLLFPTGALAQTSSAEFEGAPLLFELRVGAMWRQAPLFVDVEDLDASTTRPGAGGRFNIYFGRGALERRLSLQLNVDWAYLGSIEYFDDDLDSRARAEGHWIAFSPAFGIDVVRTSRVSVDVHVGPSIVADLTTFLLERSDENDELGDFKNVCDLRAFEDLCTERYRGSMAIGAGARAILVRRWRVHAGIDYTHLTYGRNVLVATVGWDLR